MSTKSDTTKQLNFDEFMAEHENLKQNPELLHDYMTSHLEKTTDNEDLAEENLKIKKLMSNPNFKKDISSDQDLTIALMNLIGIEEHLFFTGAKTEKTEYYDLITVVRDIRKSLLGKIIKEYEGEVWCISKHLLASSYRLMEVGTKQLDLGRKEEAYELFGKAFDLYCLFWGINKKIFATAETAESTSTKPKNQGIFDKLKKFSKTKKNEELIITTSDEPSTKTSGMMDKFKILVKKVVDCCIE